MSRMGSLILDLQEAIESGLSFEVIARRYDVPVQWVIDAASMMDEPEPDPGDMDGDHASALASVGWGTDEDYGFNDFNDF